MNLKNRLLLNIDFNFKKACLYVQHIYLEAWRETEYREDKSIYIQEIIWVLASDRLWNMRTRSEGKRRDWRCIAKSCIYSWMRANRVLRGRVSTTYTARYGGDTFSDNSFLWSWFETKGVLSLPSRTCPTPLFNFVPLLFRSRSLKYYLHSLNQLTPKWTHFPGTFETSIG